jgi:8-oxo-dGTP diphosphatase
MVLLVKKARGPYNGMYDLPGGKPEFGETPEQTLRREFLEETGLGVEPVRLLTALTTRVQHVNASLEVEDLHHIGIIYEVELAEGEDPRLASDGPDGEDSLGAAWLDESTLEGVRLSPFAAKAIRG